MKNYITKNALGIWQYRRYVPPELRSLLKRNFIVRSLKTRNYNEAILKSARLSLLTDKLFSLLHLLQFKAITEQFDINKAFEKIGGIDTVLNSMNRIGLHFLEHYTEVMRSIPDLIEIENYATHFKNRESEREGVEEVPEKVGKVQEAFKTNCQITPQTLKQNSGNILHRIWDEFEKEKKRMSGILKASEINTALLLGYSKAYAAIVRLTNMTMETPVNSAIH